MSIPTLDMYNIGEIQEIAPLSGNSHILIVTTKGKYTLRTVAFSTQMQRMFYEQAFTEYLAARGYPVRRFVTTNDGNLVFNVDGTTYFLTEYYEGSHVPDSRFKLSEVQLIEAGSRLAQLHILSKEYKGPKAQKIPFRSQYSYNIHQKVISCINGKQKKDDFDILAYKIVKEKVEYISKNPFELQEFMSCPKLMNHGDYHAGNLVFNSEGSITAVIDFEFCTDMPRIWDIALATAWLCKNKQTEAFCGSLDVKSIKKFLASYNSIYPLSYEEKVGLNKIGISACFHSIYLLNRYYLQNKPLYQIEKCSDEKEWLWWVDHKDLIFECIIDSCI